MEIFIQNIPPRISVKQLRTRLKGPLHELGVRAFDVQVFRKGGNGKLILPTVELGERMLRLYGGNQHRGTGRQWYHGNQHGKTIEYLSKNLRFSLSKQHPDRFTVSSLRDQHLQILEEEAKPKNLHDNAQTRKFKVDGIECGSWDVKEDAPPVFNSYYSVKRPGYIIFGRNGVRATLVWEEQDFVDVTLEYVVFLPYFAMETVTVGGSNSSQHITFTLTIAPNFYRKTNIGESIDLASLSLGSEGPIAKRTMRDRVSSLGSDHAVVAAFCFVYRFPLDRYVSLKNIQRLGEHRGVPAIDQLITHYKPGSGFGNEFRLTLTAIQSFEFPVAFQLTALLANGILPPRVIANFFHVFRNLVVELGAKDAATVIEEFGGTIKPPNPLDKRTAYTNMILWESMDQCVMKAHRLRQQRDKLKSAVEDEGKMAYIHHVLITPAGCYFSGPKQETQNRVLRIYKDYHDYFLRVEFGGEDGDRFGYERGVSADLIYQRFKYYMLDSEGGEGGKLIIGGRVFSFLGFSGSSLRNHTCWFMAPFEYNGESINAAKLIETLGNFKQIKSPGKCAARIGQAFSNTYKSVHVDPEAEEVMDDVVRNNRTFSDGCGTISKELLQRIWTEAPSIAQQRPCVFQIRFAGMSQPYPPMNSHINYFNRCEGRCITGHNS